MQQLIVFLGFLAFFFTKIYVTNNVYLFLFLFLFLFFFLEKSNVFFVPKKSNVLLIYKTLKFMILDNVLYNA